MNIYVQLGKRIAYLRKKKKMSQLDLALIADINKNYVSDLERGRRNPTLMILNRLSKALDVDLSTLLQGIKDYTFEDIVSTISSIRWYSNASLLFKKKFRSQSFVIFFNVWPVFFARIWVICFFK